MNALVVRIPEMLFSSEAFILAVALRLSKKASCIFFLKVDEMTARNGMHVKIIRVSQIFMVARYINDVTSDIDDTIMFSGP